MFSAMIKAAIGSNACCVFQQNHRPASIPRSPGASPERPRPSAASPGVFSQGAAVANHESHARARHHPDSRGILSGGQGPSLIPSVASRERHEHMACQQPASPASPVAPAVAFEVTSEKVQPGGSPADPSKGIGTPRDPWVASQAGGSPHCEGPGHAGCQTRA
eukprot:scaffold133246_cov36-Prasinocladus_malaysianus.AAC.1